MMRTRNERGVAFPSPLVLLSIVAVAMAGVAFVATQDDGSSDGQVQTVSRPAEPTTEPVREKPQKAQKAKKPLEIVKKAPVVKRGDTFVEIYNNSGISGLAGATAEKAQGAGWQVVGSDNWVGTIPASTVYFPPRLEAAGKVLARDLGVARTMPAVEPMGFDRLTVILTADYS